MPGRRVAMPALEAHPHVAALQGACRLLLFLCATPVALWLITTVVVPAVSLLGSPDRWQAHLERVAASEAAQADLASALLPLPGRVYQAGWPRAWAVEVVTSLLPGDDKPSATAASELPLVHALGESWRARFHGWWPLQRTYLILALTRCVYALQLVGLGAPAALYCYRLGERQAQERLQRAWSPSPARSRLWYGLCRQLTAGIPGCCFLPVSLPTLPLLVALTAIALWSLLLARRHAIPV